MYKIPGAQIAQKRKMMRLSQRKAASLIEKMYGVKLSHSYLSLIEGGQVESVGGDLRNALEDFFKINLESDVSVHRIPLYKGAKIEDYLDFAGPILAEYAVEADSDMPELGLFRGDIIVCRKGIPSEGDLAVTKKSGGFTYLFKKEGQNLPDTAGTVVFIIKNSVKTTHFEVALRAAAAKLDEVQLIRELAERTGLKEIDLVRSIAVLKGFRKD